MSDEEPRPDEVRPGYVPLKTGTIEPPGASFGYGVGLDEETRTLVLYLGRELTVRLPPEHAKPFLSSIGAVDALSWVNGWLEEIEEERKDPRKRTERAQGIATLRYYAQHPPKR